MSGEMAVVVTTVNRPSAALRSLARGCDRLSYDLFIIGDAKTPLDFQCDGARYLDVETQKKTGFSFANLCPTHSYSRKNIGYLLAAKEGASIIIETDDDNEPMGSFWDARNRIVNAPMAECDGWLNVYRYFTPELIWPRGLALGAIHNHNSPYEELPVGQLDAPVQQGLVNGDPDVDAIYRLLFPGKVTRFLDRCVVLGKGTWCPFNSQNTTWWRDAFPLLYLPSSCSFRMTDIWRSLIAQRIMWENDWHLLFHSPNMNQNRNPHNVMKDFSDEVVGYLNNATITETLLKVDLRGGTEHISQDLTTCYVALIRLGLIGEEERDLLEAWLSDLAA